MPKCFIIILEYSNGFKISRIVEDQDMRLAVFNTLSTGIKDVQLRPVEMLISAKGRKCDDSPNSYRDVFDNLSDVLATTIF